MSCSQECDQPASCPPGRDIEFEQTCSCSAEAPPFARLVEEVDPAAWLGNYFEIVLLLVQIVGLLATEVQDNTCFWTWSTSIIFSSSQWSVEFKHCFIIASYLWAFSCCVYTFHSLARTCSCVSSKNHVNCLRYQLGWLSRALASTTSSRLTAPCVGNWADRGRDPENDLNDEMCFTNVTMLMDSTCGWPRGAGWWSRGRAYVCMS